ncbi:MAG: DUF6504 family protein [Anaerolineae bacterium]
MRQFPGGDPLRVHTDPQGQPRAFVWHGATHRVASIEEVREPHLDWWSPDGEVHRLYYLVVTHRGLICEVYRDVITNAWRLARIFD